MNEWLVGKALEVAASVAPLHRYEGLAAGYTRANASALPDRRYEDVAFSLADARVAGSRLILDVAPVGGAPIHVLRHVRISPILFAMCGPVSGPAA